RHVGGAGVSWRGPVHESELSTQHQDYVDRKEDHVHPRRGVNRRCDATLCCRRSAVGIQASGQECNQARRRDARRRSRQMGSESAASSEVSFPVAVSTETAARPAASCQGSRSIRASADTTLSGIPLRSSPIAAYRKASNSEPREQNEAGGFISRGLPPAGRW